MSSNRQPVITTESGLLSLLQISDSFFPTGAFTQSYGLETYVQSELVNNKENLAQFLNNYLLKTVAASDCLALVKSYRAAEKEDWDQVLNLDNILSAQKLARESREASIKTGIRMLRVAIRLYCDGVLTEFDRYIREGRANGHHAVIFGLLGKSIGLGEKETALAFIYNTAAGMVNNAVRLIPLGQNDGQWVLVSLHDVMQEAVSTAQSMSVEDLGASAPGLEIRAMQHEHLYSRLFMS